MSATEARNHFAEVLRQVSQHPVAIERHGEVRAVMMDPEEFERMREAVEELEDIAAFDAAMAEGGENLPWAPANTV